MSDEDKRDSCSHDFSRRGEISIKIHEELEEFYGAYYCRYCLVQRYVLEGVNEYPAGKLIRTTRDGKEVKSVLAETSYVRK